MDVEYDLAYQKLKEALGNGDEKAVLDCAVEYLKVWNKNIAENQFYHLGEHREMGDKLTNYILAGHLLDGIVSYNIADILTTGELAEILVLQGKKLDSETYGKLFNKILDTGSSQDLKIIKKSEKADFESIQDKILSGTDTTVMSKFMQQFPDKANANKIHARISNLIIFSSKKLKTKEVRMKDLAIVEPYYKKYKENKKAEQEREVERKFAEHSMLGRS